MKQFVQVVGAFPSPWFPAAPCRLLVDPCLEPGGDDGRLGATDENPDMLPDASGGGELGLEWTKAPPRPARLAFGVEAVRGTFCRRSPVVRKDCDRGRLPGLSHSLVEST